MMRLIVSALLLLGFLLNANCQSPVRQKPPIPDRVQQFSAVSYFRKLLHLWKPRAERNEVSAEYTERIFQQINYRLSANEASEILAGDRVLAPKNRRQPNGLTFGQFCLLAANIEKFRYCANTQPLEIKPERSNASPHLKVFLGGSCNPTTWRADVAIPALEKLNISFYNPQVDNWTPDLIEKESRAKAEAQVLFYVMDSETRAVASAVEVAYIAGQKRQELVLVTNPYQPNQKISNERISHDEYLELESNQKFVRELVKTRGYSVFDEITSAINRTKEIVDDFRDHPSRITSILVTARAAFEHVKPTNGIIKLSQCEEALLYLGYDKSLVSKENLRGIILANNEIVADLRSPDINPAHESKIDFNLFCFILGHVMLQQLSRTHCISHLTPTSQTPAQGHSSNLQGNEIRDIYIGGSSHTQKKYFEMINRYSKAYRFSYRLPNLDSFSQPSSSAGNMGVNDLSLLNLSRVQLFLITKNTRSLTPMTLAAYCIGLKYNVVLVVEKLPDNFLSYNEELTPTGIKDYNRGRDYLMNLARAENVPIFNSVEEGMRYAAELIEYLRYKPHK